MVLNQGPNSSLGYTPFEYWNGPKPVIPRPKRRSRAAALDLQPLLGNAAPVAKSRAATAAKSRQHTPSSATKVRRSISAANPKNFKTRLSEVLVAPPKVFVHRAFRDEMSLPEESRASTPYLDSPHNTSSYNASTSYGQSSERLALRSVWRHPRHWKKRVWVCVLGTIILFIFLMMAAAATQNNQKDAADLSQLVRDLDGTSQSNRAGFDDGST